MAMLPSNYGYGGPGMFMMGSGGSDNVIPQVPLEQPKPVIRYGESSIWSTNFLTGAIAGTQARFFTTVRGATGQGFNVLAMSVAETNIKEAGRIPNGVGFDIYGIAAQLLHAATATDAAGIFGTPADTDNQIGNILSIINNGVLSWDFTQTQVWVAPLMLVGQGGGAYGAVATGDTGTPAQIGHMNNGNGAVWLYRRYPISLPGSTTFGMNVDFGSRAPAIAGSTAIGLRIVLFGFYKNVIEIA